MTTLSLTSNSEKVVYAAISAEKRQSATPNNPISQLCQDLIISDEINSSQQVKEKKQELADFFWRHLCDQVNNAPDLITESIRRNFLNFFPAYRPSIAATDSNQTVNLWLDFYDYNLNQSPPSSSLISLIFNKQLEDNLKDRIYWKIKKKDHENFLFAALEKGEEAVQTLLKLDKFIKISPEQEKKWIEKFSTEAVNKKKWLSFCKLGSSLKVLKKTYFFHSKLMGIIANRLYQTYPESIKEIAGIPYWGNFFIRFNKQFEDLNLAIYREVYQDPQPNTFCLPPINDPKFQHIYEAVHLFFTDLSSSPRCLFPKLRLNRQCIAGIGGNCFGTVIQVAKSILINQKKGAFESVLKKIYAQYTDGVTYEAFITQIAYVTIHQQHLDWYRLFVTIFQVLSKENPETRAAIIFLIAKRYEISEEKIIYFIQSLNAKPEEIEMIEKWNNHKNLTALSSIQLHFKKGIVNEAWLQKIILEMGLENNQSKLIKRMLVNFYALRQVKIRFNLQGAFPGKRILAVFKKVVDTHLIELFSQLKYADDLLKKVGVELQPENKNEPQNDAKKIKRWVQNARQGVYLLYIKPDVGAHAICMIRVNNYFYMIDPNFEEIYKFSHLDCVSSISLHCQDVYALSLKDSLKFGSFWT